jgi:hypothetical protein
MRDASWLARCCEVDKRHRWIGEGFGDESCSHLTTASVDLSLHRSPAQIRANLRPEGTRCAAALQEDLAGCKPKALQALANITHREGTPFQNRTSHVRLVMMR